MLIFIIIIISQYFAIFFLKELFNNKYQPTTNWADLA